MKQTHRIEVQKTGGRTWGVFGVTTGPQGTTQELLEGGFSTREAADKARGEWELDCLPRAAERMWS